MGLGQSALAAGSAPKVYEAPLLREWPREAASPPLPAACATRTLPRRIPVFDRLPFNEDLQSLLFITYSTPFHSSPLPPTAVYAGLVPFEGYTKVISPGPLILIRKDT